MKVYKPRRQSARWLDGDCPKGVLAIFDDPHAIDRYTVIYAEPVMPGTYADMWLGYRAMSSNPTNPLGVGTYGEMRAFEVVRFRAANAHRKCKWSSLPGAVKKLVRADLEESS